MAGGKNVNLHSAYFIGLSVPKVSIIDITEESSWEL